jgi:hypothetical protein
MPVWTPPPILMERDHKAQDAWIEKRYEERLNEACATRCYDDERMRFECWRAVYREFIYGVVMELPPDDAHEETVAERLNREPWTAAPHRD